MQCRRRRSASFAGALHGTRSTRCVESGARGCCSPVAPGVYGATVTVQCCTVEPVLDRFSTPAKHNRLKEKWNGENEPGLVELFE